MHFSTVGASTPDTPSLAAILRKRWDQLPASIRRPLRRSGIPYVASFLASYRSIHRADRFAGELVEISHAYQHSDTDEQRAALIARFDAIIDALVLPNGVKKTSYAGRQHQALEQFLSGTDRPMQGAPLRVLDLPSSSGVASLGHYERLRRTYPIEGYVLADLCLEVRYDSASGCVYDEAGTLLQVKGRERFFSLHRAHAAGDAYSLLSSIVLLPLTLRSLYLKRKYPQPATAELTPIRLVHPAVELLVRDGVFRAMSADVFALDLGDEYDLVISFNLLQRNYFSSAEIERGLANLARALKEGGYLLTGNSESFGILQKRDGILRMLHKEGEW